MNSLFKQSLCVIAFSSLFVGVLSCSSDSGQESSTEASILPGALSRIGDADTLTLEGEIVNFQYELRLEDCFNEYRLIDEETGDITDLTTIVDCRRPHDAEIYKEFVHPATAEEPYPGKTELERWSAIKCYEAFKDFVGTDYELSALEIGYIPPVQEDWEIGLYRIITCYVYVPESQLSGSMQGSKI
mgnify:CR=1 FL=1|tara:strand:+ start:9902 stop:10462 length:561 start_codon:yes stop_codon:yes gene_type:complete